MGESADKLKRWLKDKFNLIFLVVISGAFIVRLYYFILTRTQTIWWDEGEYLSTSIHWVFGIPYDINPQRPILLPLLESLIIFLGGSELLIKFLLVLLPSIGIVIITYALGKEMYDKKIGLIASAITGSFWLLLFNTTRLHVEAILMFFTYLSIYSFWKGFVQGNNKYKLLTGLFLGLSFLTKFTSVLTIISLAFFLLITERLKIFKDKHAWLSGLIFIITVLPYFIWSRIKFGSFFIFLGGSAEVSALVGRGEIGRSFDWSILKNIPHFTLPLYIILLFIGIFTLYKLILGLDLLLKKREKIFYADLFIILFMVINLSFFIFIQRSAEDRWLMPIVLSIFFLIAKGLIFTYELMIKFKVPKIIAVVIIVTLISAGSYSHIKAANNIIEAKKDTYIQVKQAAHWIKENSNKEDIILTASGPQTTYYSKRGTIGYGNKEVILKKIEELKPRYAVLSIFEGHPEWVQPYIQDNPKKFVPIHAFFLDQEQKQLALVIYEIKY